MGSRWFAPAALMLSLMMSAGAASAQSDQDKAAARSLWSQASEALSAGKYAEAIDLAGRAEALVHAPTHLLLVARAQAKLGRLVEAKETYLKVTREELAATASSAFKGAQDTAREELAAIEPRIGAVKVTLQGAGGRKVPVKIDDHEVPEALVGVYRPLDPGQHRVSAHPPGLSPVEQPLTLEDGEKKELTLVIPEAAAPSDGPAGAGREPGKGDAGGPPGGGPDTGSSKGGSALTWVGIGAGALGLAGLGVGVAFTVIGGGTQGDADDQFTACQPAGCTSSQQGEITQLDKDAASQKTIGVIGLIGGGVLLAGGVTLAVIGLGSKPKDAQQGWVMPYVTPGGGGVRGAF
ncbi:hypothetical protein [Chondromyces apiculatus]|uniref:PEGA domain-containing protein n=1 Tax=Chondromyces apiculatus DSM 436 TaxID=1192034 RepID=A0A017TFL2_9BACT|nr:hypothetical protein [Chondromyces apiculatus]EYF08024.1 Hypothetical protein CAP_7046 [Chondromyces apiculatus DSM 436]